MMAFYQNLNGTSNNSFRIGMNGPMITNVMTDLSIGGNGSLSLKPTITGTQELRFMESALNGINFVGFKSPLGVPTSTIWTLPALDGTSGQQLKTDGSKTLSWENTSVYEVYAGTFHNVNNAFTNIKYDIERFTNPDFSINTTTGAITSNITGTVKLTYNTVVKNTVTQQRYVITKIYHNSIGVIGSRTFAMSRTTSQRFGSSSKTILLGIVAGDTIEVRVKSKNIFGVKLLPNECGIVIEVL